MTTNYVRLKFRPAGASGDRTVWAEQTRIGYWTMNRQGDRPDPEELILVRRENATVIPAVMSKKYGMLMLLDDPDLNNEVDRPEAK